jgi:hypothetical protein
MSTKHFNNHTQLYYTVTQSDISYLEDTKIVEDARYLYKCVKTLLKQKDISNSIRQELEYFLEDLNFYFKEENLEELEITILECEEFIKYYL